MTSAPRRNFARLDDLPILLVHAEREARELTARLRGLRPLFVCTVAHTETAEIDGLSGAGATAELRRLTAAADVEALVHGRPLCMDGVPSNPGGAPGPVIITLAGLYLAGVQTAIFDAGLRVKPLVEPEHVTVVADRWGESIVTGHAVPHAEDLFERGLQHGRELATRAEYLVLAESVPGGTTTALSVLCGLGWEAWGMVSSSMPNNAHPLKEQVVRAALLAAGLDNGTESRGALEVTAAVGDPMQPFVAGLAIGALPVCPVLLAGGSQMAAVLALICRISAERSLRLNWASLGIATTSWVARDPTADLRALVAQVGPIATLASDLDFSQSRHAPLRRYEDFLVKEGVGAGAAAVVASLAVGANPDLLLATIEAVYERIYGIVTGP